MITQQRSVAYMPRRRYNEIMNIFNPKVGKKEEEEWSKEQTKQIENKWKGDWDKKKKR